MIINFTFIQFFLFFKRNSAKKSLTFFLSLPAILLQILFFGGTQVEAQVFTYNSPGSFQWICPDTITEITVETWGAGGRGGNVVSIATGTGGGGGGAYSRKTVNVIPGNSYTIQVGSGLINQNRDSWMSPTNQLADAFVLAKGGSNATINGALGGNGGAAVDGIGDIKYSGGRGSNSQQTSPITRAGGGGSSAGSFANGVNAGSFGNWTTVGATAPLNGGNGGSYTGGNITTAGNAGSFPGGGGSGAYSSSVSPLPLQGGNGGGGQVRIISALKGYNNLQDFDGDNASNDNVLVAGFDVANNGGILAVSVFISNQPQLIAASVRYSRISNFAGGDLSETFFVIRELNPRRDETVKYYWETGKGYFSGLINGQPRRAYFIGATLNGNPIPSSRIVEVTPQANVNGYTLLTDNPLITDTMLAIRLGPVEAGGDYVDLEMQFAFEEIDLNSTVFDVIVTNPLIAGLAYDYDDIPVSHGIARHAPGIDRPAIFMGNFRPDFEAVTVRNADADGDDVNTQAQNTPSYTDEEGPLSDYFPGQAIYTVTIPYFNNNTTGQINGWIDWNSDGVFQTTERAYAAIPGGAGNVTLVWRVSGAADNEGTIPGAITPGRVYSRFRIGSIPAEVSSPIGTASDGEVQGRYLTLQNAPLPVQLLYFTSTLKACDKVELNWATASETNNDFFGLERSSDNLSWETIHRANGAGNSNSFLAYNFTDLFSNNHQYVYYRLSQVDFDGRQTVFPVVSVDRSLCGRRVLMIYPNPTSSILVIDPSGEVLNDLRISIIDGKGAEVFNRQLDVHSGKEEMDVSNLPPGIYTVRLQSLEIKETARIVIGTVK